MNYTLVTGYYSNDQKRAEFFDLWWKNTFKYINPKECSDIFVINSNSTTLPKEKLGKWVDLSFNLGHVHDLDWNDNPNKKFGGWSMSFIMGAMLAYANGTDLLYKEQDCLAFGDWVTELYSHDKDIVMGHPDHSDQQGLEQSLFLMKHNVLLEFVNYYLALNRSDAGINFLRPEQKFRIILQNYFADRFTFTGMGYGRSKPADLKKSLESGEAFYMQKLTDEEVEIIKLQNN